MTLREEIAEKKAALAELKERIDKQIIVKKEKTGASTARIIT